MKKWMNKGKHSRLVYGAIVCFALFLIFVTENNSREKSTLGSALQSYMADKAASQMLGAYFPIFSFAVGEEEPVTPMGVLGVSVLREIPIYGYFQSKVAVSLAYEDEDTRRILEEEQVRQEEEMHHGEIQEGIIPGEDMLEQMIRENGGETGLDEEQNTPDLAEGENQKSGQPFVPRQKTNSYDWESLKEYGTLVSTFYAIDAYTMLGSEYLDVEKLTSKDVRISKEDPSPQILIYHTHSREAFADSVGNDASQTVVGVGDRLAKILTEEYGYGVLHHTEEYDTIRDQAYAKALPAIEKLLEENPSIQVVIDLHRDSGAAGVHRAIEIDGKPTATFMLFNGISRTKKTGEISYLKNENLDTNLAFSFQMQVNAGEYYPGLTRKIYLKGYRYNMHLKPRYLLIELGDENNTLEEVMNTCDPLAHILDLTLYGER